MSTDFNETPGAPRYRRPSGNSLGQMWQNPIFKLVVIVILVAGAALAGVKMLSGRKEQAPSALPSVTAPVSGSGVTPELTPEYAQAIQQSDQTRVEAARAQGESAIPTPMQTGMANPQVEANVGGDDGTDPLKAFQAMMERGESPQRQQPAPPPPPPPVPPEMVQALSGAMRAQMDTLLRAWQPEGMKTVSSSIKEADILARTAPQPVSGIVRASGGSTRPVVSAGSIYYGQMLVEANSDVPGPIMAQVLTGPLAGGKAIGDFETFRNHLVIHFDVVAFRNKQVEVDAIALDPNTTLGGVATEVDPRYFERVLLPAASAFLEAYGKALSEPTSTVTVSGTGATDITTQTDEQDSRDAMFAGLEEASSRVGRFLDEEATATKRLVRVAVGTPIGIFFVKPACGLDGQCNAAAASHDESQAAE
jgi:intracellular multiplication protein IcmE